MCLEHPGMGHGDHHGNPCPAANRPALKMRTVGKSFDDKLMEILRQPIEHEKIVQICQAFEDEGYTRIRHLRGNTVVDSNGKKTELLSGHVWLDRFEKYLPDGNPEDFTDNTMITVAQARQAARRAAGLEES